MNCNLKIIFFGLQKTNIIILRTFNKSSTTNDEAKVRKIASLLMGICYTKIEMYLY